MVDKTFFGHPNYLPASFKHQSFVCALGRQLACGLMPERLAAMHALIIRAVGAVFGELGGM
jgi:hypothetical protein